MPTFADAASVAEAFPEVTIGDRHGHRTWLVRGKAFSWERPFHKTDLKRFGDTPPPSGDILAVTVADQSEKQAVLASDPATFEIDHFRNRPVVLVQLEAISASRLQAVMEDAWLACAPTALARDYLQSRRADSS